MGTVGYDPKRSDFLSTDPCSWCNHKPETPRRNWILPDIDNRILGFGSYRCFQGYRWAYWSWKASGFQETEPEMLLRKSTTTCEGVSE